MRDLQAPPSITEPYTRSQPVKRNRGAVIFYAFLWIVLVAAGVAGAKAYSDRIQQQVSDDLQQQTSAQIANLQQDYNSRITKLEEDYHDQLAQMESKIEALNELLNFTKDNADSKTDNSNKLYSQLADVKKQLSALQKSMDVLR
jgi:esterase/lipase